MGRLLPCLVGLMLSACSPPMQIDGFPEDLEQRGGCRDVVFFAHDEADTLLFEARADGLVAETDARGEETSFELTIPEDGLDVRVEEGERISEDTCSRADDGARRVDTTYEASRGTATVTVTPGTRARNARASLSLQDVEFDTGTSHSLLLDEFAIEDVEVGWSPD